MLLAAGCLLLAFLAWLGTFHVAPFQAVDAELLRLAVAADDADTPVEAITDAIVLLIEPPVYAVLCAAVVVAGWRWGGPRPALVAALMIAGANVTTQLLKPALGVPRLHDEPVGQIGAASWPSGHVTATTIAVLALLLVAPRRRRATIAVCGGILVAAMSFAVTANNWHYPSDALGALGVAGAWGAAATAALSSRRPAATAAPRRRSPRATG